MQNPKQILALHKKLNKEKNIFTDATLKKLVMDHLYMYEVSHDKKTSICAQLSIGVENSKKQIIKKHKR